MSDDDGDNELRDAFGDRITDALNLRSRDDASGMAPVATHRRAQQRVLVGALVVALLAGTVALIADRTRHTARQVRPVATTTVPTETTTPTSTAPTTTTTTRPALVPVTAEQLLSDVPIGALCGHPAGRLHDGKLPGIPEGAGFVELRGSPYSAAFASSPPDAKTIDTGDLDGDGVADAVAIVGCSAGDDDVDTQAFAWGPGPRLIGMVPFEDGGTNTGDWPSSVTSVAIDNGVIRLRGIGWQEYECRTCPSLAIERLVTMRADGSFATDRRERLGHTIAMDGIGPVRAGTPIADLASLTNAPIEVSDPNSPTTGQYSPDSPCVYFAIRGADRISGTGGNGVVEAIYFSEPAYRTERGIGPGSTVAEVEAAYPGEITRRDNMYRDFDDLYVGSTGTSGAVIRFTLDIETGTHVDQVISGHQPAVSASEGCS
jgi:hypothetical protein